MVMGDANHTINNNNYNTQHYQGEGIFFMSGGVHPYLWTAFVIFLSALTLTGPVLVSVLLLATPLHVILAVPAAWTRKQKAPCTELGGHPSCALSRLHVLAVPARCLPAWGQQRTNLADTGRPACRRDLRSGCSTSGRVLKTEPRHCATSRKVAGLIPGEAIRFPLSLQQKCVPEAEKLCFWGAKRGRCLPPSVSRLSTQCGILDIS
jgi:hypothetical protein